MNKFWLTIGVVSFFLVGCAEDGADSEKQVETKAVEVVKEKSTGETEEAGEKVEFTVSEPEAAATNVKLNPPHGEPGHDCAIAVGAPLDGSGGQVQGTSPQVQPTAQPTAQPMVQPNLKVNAPSSGGGINPPHGQPGHDCAVAVGAPLPVK